MKPEIRNLYTEKIKALANAKSHWAELTTRDIIIEAHNPMCGDDFQIGIQIQGDHVQRIRYKGYGCHISKASTALLAKKLEGMRISEIMERIHAFLMLADAEEQTEPHSLWKDTDALAFSMARDFPERHTCVTLSWEALLKYLSSK